MADEQKPQAPKSPWTPELIRYIATIIALLALAIVLACTGQRDALNTVLGGLVGFATSGHPSGGAGSGTVVATTMGLAIAANIATHLAG
jgi:hypothetical protein